jgi:hypothetical protein
MEMKMDCEVKAIKIGFLWFKKVHFEITYGDNPRITDYCYSIADLILKLIEMEVNKHEIWKIISAYENKHYKVK